MEILITTLISWSMGILGFALYTLIKLWKDRKIISFVNLLNKNKFFWIVGLSLNLVICLLLAIDPELTAVVQTLGIAVEDGVGGFVLLGAGLASGANNAPIGGRIENTAKAN